MPVPRTLEQLIDIFTRHEHTGLDGSRDLKPSVVVPTKVPGADAAVATNYGIFFIAPYPLELIQLQEVHGTAGIDPGSVTISVERLQGTEALDAGDDLLSTALSLKATANTVQTGTLTTTRSNLILSKGDRLALKDAGTLTAVADVCVTVWLRGI